VPDFLLQLHGGFECAVRTQRINRSGEGTFCVRGTNALLRPLESRLK
jgi:radical SAM superfamily enzyme